MEKKGKVQKRAAKRDQTIKITLEKGKKKKNQWRKKKAS
jgi:hypothetical protein